MDKTNREYSEDDIQVLEGLEAVRVRPGMYIGSTGERGLHHLVYEVIDNSIDEVMAGRADEISVKIHEDGSASVIDNGSGIPVAKHRQTGLSTLETVLTVLHAGGKFDNDAYKYSGGLHGVGISVVNALSKKLIATVKREGKIYQQEFSRGKRLTDLEIIGESEETGTKIQFFPDEEIFDTTDFDFKTLMKRFREMAFLNKGVKINFSDDSPKNEEDKKDTTFHFEGGIKEYIEFLNESKTPIHKDIIYFEGYVDEIDVELALQYTDGYSENIHSYANNINTYEGGTHLTGLRSALTRTINDYGRSFKLIKDSEDNLSGDDVREGLTGIVSIKISDPQFEGQTKTKLGNTEARNAVETFVNENLRIYLEENPQVGKIIIEKCMAAQRARNAARKARDLTRKRSVLDNTTLPGKLADCQSNNNEETEIFIVEGDSAGGSAKTGRDRRFQAILPLRGKILNIEKVSLARALDNNEIKSMITAFGTGIGPEFDITKLRYGKIIIMTDADVDGAHIMTLLLTFLYRYMPELIEGGHVYVAQPPLFSIKRGTKILEYCYKEENLAERLKEYDRSKVKIQRYKGLGEMNDDQLWETTMDPENRILLQVNIDKESSTIDQIFSVLMGDKVEPRRNFIVENASKAQNIDA